MNNKMRIGFYIQNKGYPDADVRFPERGNPGIGGTQFTTVSLAYYLKKYYSDRLEIVLLVNAGGLFPEGLDICCADDVVDALAKSEQENCDIFVFKSCPGDHGIYKALENSTVKSIARSNNFPGVPGLRRISESPQIKSHVCVGHEQLDVLRDHAVFKKSTVIFDLFNSSNFKPAPDIVKTSDTVVFLGSIIPPKGFHKLAEAWPKVLKHKPDAKLIVIGSGKLYNRNSRLGKWKVAEESYEANCIRPFLADEQGNVHPSVHFAGLLGEEKIEILQHADIGIVNPTGLTEVCPGSALEIQSCGTPVVSIAKQGLLDTVVHNETGLLGKRYKDLANNIVYLLENPEVAKKFGENGMAFVDNKFSEHKIARQWFDLFVMVCKDRLPIQQPLKDNYFYRLKLLREGLRVTKQTIPGLEKLPSFLEVSYRLRKSRQG
ncbi:MAG: glycosyltransferase family 4 protein [Cyanobacteria bacterium J06555_13]